jgi:hypothetical protein
MSQILWSRHRPTENRQTELPRSEHRPIEPGLPRAVNARGSSGARSRRIGARALFVFATILGAASFAFVPSAALACACGCAVFDVGANSAFPNDADSGLSVYFRYNHMDQTENWAGSSRAPAAYNGDKSIKTDFFTFGGQYMITHDWGVMVELPVFHRTLTTTGDGTAYPLGQVYSSTLTDLGDLMVQAVYAGFSPDLSTGVSFGVKLPTGNYTGPFIPPNQSADGANDPTYDRDSLPGSGSTDLLWGIYHVGAVTADGALAYFTQARFQMAVMERAGVTGTYRPGNELDTGAGLTYNLGAFGPLSKVAPVLQLIFSDRSSDGGTASNPSSGYRRLLVAPGIDLRAGKVKVYADVLLPLITNTTAPSASAANIAAGDVGQLVAPVIWRLQIGYEF